MKLKRLEIIGFKSFVDKTVIQFDKDITAVVGPNGCGKSNIVDAIRWSMGEQSAKHLRGKSMEDVIFSGSDTRAPLSMASVELTLSTEGYQTPAAYLDHSEISICRRLYRTGESEYMINKVPVRLRDITELFLGTGIGKRAYSVIEQGRISQVVTAKPEERRFYIEEVAGISKFKSRKESALRRMEATHQNLLRLTDITDELERQMRSLDRQAKKATKYKELKTEYEAIDLAVTAYDYNDLYQRQESFEKQMQDYSEKESSSQAKLAENENEIEELRLGVAEDEKELQELQNNLFEVTNLVRLTEEKIKHRRQEKDELEGRLRNLKEEIDLSAKTVARLTQQTEDLNEQKCLADLELEDLEEKVAHINSGVQGKQEELSLLKEEVELLRENIYNAESRLGRIETQKQNLVARRQDLSLRLERENEEKENLSKQSKNLEKVFREATSSLDSLKQLKFDLSTKTDELADELKLHRENLKKEEETLAEIKEELTLRRSRLTSLEELQKNFEGYHEGTRSVLMKKKDLNEEGIFGSVADFVETDPEYEGAVSAVLGEKLQYVVVKSQQQGVEAVEYLKSAATGRTSFIPMEVRARPQSNPVEAAPAMGMAEGVLGPLKKFVHLKADYHQLGEFLFGDTVLVKDLQQALNLWAGGLQKDPMVTLDGEVVDTSGVITGGSLANTSKALLEKKREMKDLGELISRLTEEVRDKEVERHRLSSRVKSLESTLETVKSSSMEEAIKIANQEKDLSHFKKEMETIEDKQKSLSERIAQEEKSLGEIIPELAALEEEELELKQRWERDKGIFEEKKTILSDRQSLYESSAQELTQFQIQLAQAKERHSSLDKDLKRIFVETYTAKLDGVIAQSQLEESQARLEMVQKDEVHLTKVLDKKFSRQSDMEDNLKAKRAEYDQKTHVIREKENDLRQFRHASNEATKMLNEVTVSLTEVRGSMKQLMEQCLERHQRSLADIYKDYLGVEINFEEARARIEELRDQLRKLGEVNTAALEEFEEIQERYSFLKQQKEDLEESMRRLEKVINKINRTTRDRFHETFNLVNERFKKVFPILFKGGHAELKLTDEDNLLETGVEIVAQPPGKKPQTISLLSGGEKALTAVSLVFSIFQIKPSPFCVLDEVDAPMDDVNVGRYIDMIREMTSKSQFIVITHNKTTMQKSDALYGVTMQEPGVSKLVSVELD